MMERLDRSDAAKAAIAAEGLGPRPFSAPGYPDPPEGTAL